MSFTYFISSDIIGYQDPELGRNLIQKFFLKLVETADKPSHILFVERGVQLLLPDSPVVDALKMLNDKYGVELLACVTCLEYYGLKEQIEVGKISSMAEIIAVMHESGKVIHM